MDIYNCTIKKQSNYSDYDATSLLTLSCQPKKIPKEIGFRFQHDIKLNLKKSKYNSFHLTVPICRNNKVLNTEVVYFKKYENNKVTDHQVRVPVSCGE